jgi:hypothetical protein
MDQPFGPLMDDLIVGNVSWRRLCPCEAGTDPPRYPSEATPPLPGRLAGGLSILLWVAVVACGRWIGFTMQVG